MTYYQVSGIHNVVDLNIRVKSMAFNYVHKVIYHNDLCDIPECKHVLWSMIMESCFQFLEHHDIGDIISIMIYHRNFKIGEYTIVINSK